MHLMWAEGPTEPSDTTQAEEKSPFCTSGKYPQVAVGEQSTGISLSPGASNMLGMSWSVARIKNVLKSTQCRLQSWASRTAPEAGPLKRAHVLEYISSIWPCKYDQHQTRNCLRERKVSEEIKYVPAMAAGTSGYLMTVEISSAQESLNASRITC